METYLAGHGYCDDKILLNMRTMNEMLDEVLSENGLNQGDHYFFNEIRSHLNDLEKYYLQANAGGDSSLTIMFNTQSLIESAEILAKYWYAEQQTVGMLLNESKRLKWVIDFTCMSFSEYCMDLLQIVQSADETEELHTSHVMLYYMVLDLIGDIAGYASLKGFDLGNLNDGNIIVSDT
jgi:hypothetical protein